MEQFGAESAHSSSQEYNLKVYDMNPICHFKTYLADEAGTKALGTAFAHTLTPGLTCYLHGDLGAGKTGRHVAALAFHDHLENFAPEPLGTLAQRLDVGGRHYLANSRTSLWEVI